jgi:hypothetical protein
MPLASSFGGSAEAMKPKLRALEKVAEFEVLEIRRL